MTHALAQPVFLFSWSGPTRGFLVCGAAYSVGVSGAHRVLRRGIRPAGKPGALCPDLLVAACRLDEAVSRFEPVGLVAAFAVDPAHRAVVGGLAAVSLGNPGGEPLRSGSRP